MLLPAGWLRAPREIFIFSRDGVDPPFVWLLWLLACCFGFRLENASETGSRFVENPHKLGRRRQEEPEELGLKDLLGWKVGEHFDLFGIQEGVVQNARLDWRPLEFRHKRLENLGRGANVIFARDHRILSADGAVQFRQPEGFDGAFDKGIPNDVYLRVNTSRRAQFLKCLTCMPV